MNTNRIALSAYMNEKPKIDRLENVVNYIKATPDISVLGKIFGLHDHKGDLTATWMEPPTEGEKAALKSVWGNPDVGDGNAHVKHTYAMSV